MKGIVYAVAPVLAVSVSPVQKVVQLLGELKAKVQKDLDAEASAMEEYSTWCDDQITESGYTIKTATADIERYEAVVEESSGNIAKYENILETSGTDIAAKQGELAEAKSLRGKEHEDFEAAEKELVDSVDMLARAASVLKRELSFAQTGGKVRRNKNVEDVVAALSQIVSASWVSAAQQKQLSSFLEADDELSLHQPQAKVVAYESKSGGIVDTIKGMQEKAEDQLASLRKDETKSRHSFEMLEQSLTDAVANLENAVEEATSQKGNAEEVKAKAQEDLGRTQALKKATEEYKAKTSQECQTKASEWESRQKSATEEMAAITKASEILSSGVKVFAQVKSSTKVVKAIGAYSSDDTRDRLQDALRKLGRKFNSFGLMQLANRATSDPFVKIRGLIESMIAKLEQQAAEEATKEAFCQEETAKSSKKRAAKEKSVDKYTTRMDKAKASIGELELQIADLSKQLTDMAKSVAEATKIRGQEKADYDVASKDQKDSIEAVAQAIQVLQDFYGGGASFVQQPSFASSKSDSGSNIISFLEVAQSDFSTMLAETEADEAEAKKAYDTMMQESAVSKATMEASVKGKTSEVKSLKVALEDSAGDLATASKELDAVMDYIEKLKPQCENKAMSYEERKARREAELAGLKQALDILSGEEAALTFLQKRRA